MTADTPSALTSPEHEGHTQAERARRPVGRGLFGAARDAVAAFVGAVLAIVPHVMHHIGLVTGAAFLTGAGGNSLFYVLGLVFSLPMLRRLHRRFRTWQAPAIAVMVFTVVFSLSAFVIGPAISGETTQTDTPSPPTDTPSKNLDPHGHD